MINTTYRGRIYRDPAGRHWKHSGETRHEKETGWLHRLYPAVQDPGTGRWERGTGDPIESTLWAEHPPFVEVSADPLADTRIARLHSLLMTLLADYTQHTGHAHPQDAEVQQAMEDVAFLPVQARRARIHAARVARRR